MSEKTVAGKLASELAERNLQEAMKETSSFDYANFDMFEETDEKLATMIFNFLTGRSDELPDRSMIEEVKDDLRGINDKNMERIINNMSLIIAIMGKYKELSNEVKSVIPLAINICKEKTELLRKNAAILMARYAKAAPENEEYLRALHGMEVLVSVSSHLKI